MKHHGRNNQVHTLRSWANGSWGRVRAFDIETSTNGKPYVYPNGSESLVPVGLDPRVSQVTTISTVDDSGQLTVLDDEESDLQIIRDFLALNGNGTGILIGWNSTFFDLPFMKVRMSGRHPSSDFTFSSYPDWVKPKYGYPEWADYIAPWTREWNTAEIGKHSNHYDLAPLFKEFAEKNGIKHSLKPICEFLDIEMVTVDASKMHELTRAERIEYNVSDSQGLIRLFRWISQNSGELLLNEEATK